MWSLICRTSLREPYLSPPLVWTWPDAGVTNVLGIECSLAYAWSHPSFYFSLSLWERAGERAYGKHRPSPFPLPLLPEGEGERTQDLSRFQRLESITNYGRLAQAFTF